MPSVSVTELMFNLFSFRMMVQNTTHVTWLTTILASSTNNEKRKVLCKTIKFAKAELVELNDVINHMHFEALLNNNDQK